MNDRAQQLKEIAGQVRHLDESPLYSYRMAHGYAAVIGEGDVDAEIMFIGEAPGEQEAKTGRPFVGAAGQILDELLGSVCIERAEVYITNVVKDRPPDNRDPTSKEVQIYAPFLWRQIEIIRPKVIVTLGRFAMDWVLKRFDLPEQGQKISNLHGTLLQAQAPYGPLTILPLFHPAVAFYSAGRKGTLRDDFQALRRWT